MRALTQRERRLVALAILIGLIAAVWLAVVSPILSGFSARAEERRELLARYERNQRTIGAISAYRARADAQRRAAPRYAFVAATPLLATDLLRDRVSRTVGQVGGRLNAVEDLQATAPPGWIRVRADLQLTLEQLVQLLRRLQNEEPYLIVEYTSASANEAYKTRRLSPMDVRLEISARHQPSRAR
jgi:hypothetical protein